MLDDAPRGWRCEVRTEEGGALLLASMQKAAPGRAGLLGVKVEAGFPFRVTALNGMVDQITGDDALMATRADAHRHVPGAVTGSELGGNLAGDLMAAFDPVHQSGVDDRPDRVFHE